MQQLLFVPFLSSGVKVADSYTHRTRASQQKHQLTCLALLTAAAAASLAVFVRSPAQHKPYAGTVSGVSTAIQLLGQSGGVKGRGWWIGALCGW